jgi:hypothetical protein
MHIDASGAGTAKKTTSRSRKQTAPREYGIMLSICSADAYRCRGSQENHWP